MALTKVGTEQTAEATLHASGSASLDIVASVRIEAETRRVLYALATPEYMEAWLHLPGVERIDCHAEQRSYDKFRIDMICSGARQGSIRGACRLSRPNRVTYLWESDQDGSLTRSLVEIYLYGGPDHWTLKLKHSGLSSKRESEWYSRMWERSLDKLSRVFGGIGAVPMSENTVVKDEDPHGGPLSCHCD